MSRTRRRYPKILLSAVGGLALLFVLCAFPQTALAAGDSIESLDLTVELQEDGGAYITEVCEVSIATGTEYYLAFVNLDNQVISDFSVTDENGTEFTDVGAWNSNQSREEKAGKSGLIKTATGYEMCWGFGEYGQHTYTLRYHITNVVKGYPEADMMTQVFVPEGTNNAGSVRLTIEYAKEAFTSENTGIWAFGFGGSINLEDGKIVVRSDGRVSSSQFVGVMAEFDKGMFSPTDVRSRSVQDVKDQAFEGSDYGDDGGNGEGISNIFSRFFQIVMGLIPMIAFVGGFGALIGYSSLKSKSALRGSLGGMTPAYKDPPYSRELPFGGSLSATYSRLVSLRQASNEGLIIGAFLLKWVRSGQVDIIGQTVKNRTESAIGLREARPDMEPVELSLYKMLVSAAGSDGILQNKEFEKWSRTNYVRVQTWLTRYENQGLQKMREMGAVSTQDAKALGLFKYQKNVLTPQGDAMTVNMFGFKKYLQDFTIINEREAKEVQLWDEYLVFAQVFGIAETVAKQFEALYPDFFRGLDPATGQMSPIDMYILISVSNSFGRSMSQGYHSGMSAARSDGGGGSSSFGGGGGFSGGGGGGGMGSR